MEVKKYFCDRCRTPCNAERFIISVIREGPTLFGPNKSLKAPLDFCVDCMTLIRAALQPLPSNTKETPNAN